MDKCCTVGLGTSKICCCTNGHKQPAETHSATKSLFNTRFVWHGMNIDVANWCRSCKGCQTAKISRNNKPAFGKFRPTEPRFDHVHIDIAGPFPYSDSFKYLLTCVDRFTHWTEAIPIVDIKAKTVADAFFSVISLALLETVQRANTLSRAAWSNVPSSA